MVFEVQRSTERAQPADKEADRKRAMPMLVSSATQTDSKRPCPANPAKQVENNGWGPIFKSRENFVEMHIC